MIAVLNAFLACRGRRWFQPGLVLVLLCLVTAAGRAQTTSIRLGKGISVHVAVTDDKGKTVEQAKVELLSGEIVKASATTDKTGKAQLEVPAGSYRLVVNKQGYIRTETDLQLAASVQTQDVDVVLAPAALSKQEVNVNATSENPVTETVAPAQGTLDATQVKELPDKPATVADVLPLVPAVVRDRSGTVHIAGRSEEHSTLLVNSVDVTDPATGMFGLTVPIDAVETIAVSESPYLAQYGRFTAGVVTAETRRGGEKWEFSLNDPLPDFRIRSWHLQGLKDATPRLNFSGPIIKDKFYLVEGAEYSIVKSEVYTLPFPENQITRESVNSYTQFDYVVSPSQTITASLHFAPHRVDNAGLNSFNPIPLTPNAAYHPYTASIMDRMALAGGVLQSIVAYTHMGSAVTSKGTEDMIFTPDGNLGNYFSNEHRTSSRLEWIENYTTRGYHALGLHTLQFGITAAQTENDGVFSAQPVLIEDGSGHLLQRYDFSAGTKFSIDDFAPAGYLQDHWIIGSRFAIDVGLRTESQSVTHTVRWAPRAGMVWSLNPRTVIRGGAGVFYDTVPLNIFAFNHFPEETITTYGPGCDPANVPACSIVDGPRTYINLMDTVSTGGFLFVSRSQRTGNFAPYSIAWHVELEERFRPWLIARIKYFHSENNNQLSLTPEIFTNQSAMVLSTNGASQIRQIEFTSQIGTRADRRFFFSYVRQHARGTLNDAADYLSDFPFPVVRTTVTGSLAGEIPNRFLLWGTYLAPKGFRLTPRLEYRNGFPWQPIDVYQNYVTSLTGPQDRFPRYFTLGVRVSHDFKVLKGKHAIRVSVTGDNITNHINPLEVHNNVADPAFGTVFGNNGRRIFGDFDFLY